MKTTAHSTRFFFLGCLFSLATCQTQTKEKGPENVLINEMNLKRGDVIFCGPPIKQLGSVNFETSCKEVKGDFNLGMMLLHSFEYDEAEKVFARIIDEDPSCAMAYWGVAMSNFHPLWSPPNGEELAKGTKAIAIAQSLTKSKREEAYLNAITAYYANAKELDHRTRSINFEKAMENLQASYPEDKETSILYALALTAAADPADKTFSKQKKAGSILQSLYPAEPNHPGIIHYIIHTYDSPELAERALPAARRYASIAPSSAHALHMPSHIFTRLGMWDDCIKSNLASVASAQCYADSSGIKGHWDEEIHGLDYLTYAYLQKGDNARAKEQWDYLKTIQEVSPVNFKVAYAFASIPSRYLLENKMWKEAAVVTGHIKSFSWDKFPLQNAILHFTRLMGNVNSGNLPSARAELAILYALKQSLINMKDAYSVNQVDIQIKTSEAWIHFREGKTQQALTNMIAAADLEDKTDKRPVTPGEVVPARELLGDMLLEMNKPEEALSAYEADLKLHAKRFNGLYGAAKAAKMSGNLAKARNYFSQLSSYEDVGTSRRPEISEAITYLARNGSH